MVKFLPICCSVAFAVATTTFSPDDLRYDLVPGFTASHGHDCDTQEGKLDFGPELRDSAIFFQQGFGSGRDAVLACSAECILLKGCGSFTILHEGLLKDCLIPASGCGRCVLHPKCLTLKSSANMTTYQSIAGPNVAAKNFTKCNGYNFAPIVAAGYCGYTQTRMVLTVAVKVNDTLDSCAAACSAKGWDVCDGFSFEYKDKVAKINTAGGIGECLGGKIVGGPEPLCLGDACTGVQYTHFYRRLHGTSRSVRAIFSYVSALTVVCQLLW